jgi:hypothetical protein
LNQGRGETPNKGVQGYFVTKVLEALEDGVGDSILQPKILLILMKMEIKKRCNHHFRGETYGCNVSCRNSFQSQI